LLVSVQFASARLKPAKTRLMTVEIDQAALLRSQTAPAAMNGSQIVPMGTPSIVSSSSSSISVSSGNTGVTSPTVSMMSIPIGNDSLINKKADPAQGLYQTCVALRERLMLVPDFEQFLEPLPDTVEDPVTQLWRCFRMGSSLCVLFNAMRPVSLIEDDRLKPNLKNANYCKAATYHFLQGIKKELNIDGEDSFMIHNLYSDDTTGFVKVCFPSIWPPACLPG
jgi:cell division control protein 24